MNDTQPPTVTPTSPLERLIVAGVISTLIYCCLTSAIWLLPFASPGSSAAYSILNWTWWSLLVLSIPGFALGMQAGYIINPNSAIDTGMILTYVTNLLLWFSLGGIPASIFRKNRRAVMMWIVLFGVVEIVGWITYGIIFRGLTL